MTDFSTLITFGQFEESVRGRARYIHEKPVQQFLAGVAETSKKRRKKILTGRSFFRAQKGSATRIQKVEGEEMEIETAYSAMRMIPDRKFVGDGRANPKGIPFLYMATTGNTAMAEVRPWMHSRISLAQFKVMENCLVVDCSSERTPSWLLNLDQLWKMHHADAADRELSNCEPQNAANTEEGVWGDIGFAFSKPVEPNDSSVEYLPTQIIAETFRSMGYDGIVYKSLLTDKGKNVVLFDVAKASLMNCTLYETRGVSFRFTQLDDTYYIPEHYPDVFGAESTQTKSID